MRDRGGFGVRRCSPLRTADRMGGSERGGRVGAARFAGLSAYTLRAPRSRLSGHAPPLRTRVSRYALSPAARPAPTLPASNLLVHANAGRSADARRRCPQVRAGTRNGSRRGQHARRSERGQSVPKGARAVHAPKSSEGLGTGARPLARSKRPALSNGVAWQRSGSAGLAACKRWGARGRAQTRATCGAEPRPARFAPSRAHAHAGRAPWSPRAHAEFAQ
jgi:hypothetical protein